MKKQLLVAIIGLSALSVQAGAADQAAAAIRLISEKEEVKSAAKQELTDLKAAHPKCSMLIGDTDDLISAVTQFVDDAQLVLGQTIIDLDSFGAPQKVFSASALQKMNKDKFCNSQTDLSRVTPRNLVCFTSALKALVAASVTTTDTQKAMTYKAKALELINVISQVVDLVAGAAQGLKGNPQGTKIEKIKATVKKSLTRLKDLVHSCQAEIQAGVDELQAQQKAAEEAEMSAGLDDLLGLDA